MPARTNLQNLEDQLHKEYAVLSGKTTWQALKAAEKAKREAKRTPARTPAKPEARVTEAEARAKLAAYIG